MQVELRAAEIQDLLEGHHPHAELGTQVEQELKLTQLSPVFSPIKIG